ncbi:cytochrome P450 [Sporichthya brevicatena]|uniref:Cytochrome P450 n=1 Tax=Sporichthya brevicatena TaxID=171442 RepID=A0ABP3SCH4_9ACTN
MASVDKAQEAAAPADYASPGVAACPYDFYDRARVETPAYPVPAMGGFMVTRYDTVCAVAKDTATFSSLRPTMGAGDPEFDAIRANGYPAVAALVTCDPPEHMRYRKLVNKPFTPKSTLAHEHLIRKTVADLIDRFEADGHVEIMSQFALPFPTTIIGAILGVPEDGLQNFGRWADIIAEMASGALPRERGLECARGMVEMQLYFADLIEQRRAEPGDDLLSAMITARADEERPLDLPEILELIRIFVAGGTESTASLLGSAMYLLLTHPEQFEAVLADFSLIPAMLEEVLRLESPVQWNPRMVYTEGAQIGDVPIPANSRVMLGWGAANRDPEIYGPDADRFDIFRKGPSHTAFGHANHMCLGAPLARLEARIACEQLFSRLEDIQLAVAAEDVQFVAHGVVRRVTGLPLTFRPARKD